MEVTSRFIEDADLGRLHVVRFEPENPSPQEHAAVFNSYNGRVTTIDGFALPYQYAATSGIVTDYIERPSTGSSSPIEDGRLRKNYRKHGFIEISDVLVEALSEDPLYRGSAKRHAAGFSLGGHASAIYLDSVGNLAASNTVADPAGTCSVNHLIGSSRFLGYLGFETIAKQVGLVPEKEPLFDEYRPAFEEFMESTREAGITEPPQLTKRDQLTEFHEVTMPTQGESLRAMGNVMMRAAAQELSFEWRASFTPMRFITDHRTIKEVNEMLERLDARYPDQETVQCGFLQKTGMAFWHDLATDPKIVDVLMSLPMSSLRRRLRYFR